MAKTPKAEYRIVYRRPGIRTQYVNKPTLAKARKDAMQILEERDEGRLAPYMNDTEIVIEERHVTDWVEIPLEPVYREET